MNKLRRILAVTKMELVTDVRRQGSKNLIQKIGLVLAVLLVIAYIGGIGYTFSKEVLNVLVTTNSEEVFIQSVMILGAIITVVTSIMSVTLSVGKSKTYAVIDAMPISSRERFTGRIIATIIKSYSTLALIILVPLIYYGVFTSQGVLYYLRMVVGMFFLPILPAIIMFIIGFVASIILKHIFSKRALKHANFVLAMIFLVVYFKLVYGIDSQENSVVVMKMMSILQNEHIRRVAYIPIKIANLILNIDVAKNLAIIVAVNFGIILGLIYTFGNIYLKEQIKLNSMGLGNPILNKLFSTKKEKGKQIVNEQNMVKGGSRANTSSSSDEALNSFEKAERIKELSKNFDKEFKQKNPVITYIKREYGFFFKNPMLLFNTILVPVILPIFMLGGAYSGFTKQLTAFKENPVMVITLPEKADMQISGEEIPEDLTKEIEEAEMPEDGITIKDGKDVPKLEELIQEAEKINPDSNVYTRDNSIIVSFDGIKDEEKRKQVREDYTEAVNKMKEKENIAIINEKDMTIQYNFLENMYLIESTPQYLLEQRKKLKEEIKDISVDPKILFLTPIVLVAVLLLSSTNLSAVMFSKDKDEINVLKTIPIGLTTQFRLKTLPAILCVLITLIAYIVLAEIIIPIGLYKAMYGILGIIVAIILAVAITNLEVLLDLRFPNLNWSEEIMLVKRSFKVFMSTLAKMALFIGAGILGGFLISKNKVTSEQYMYMLIAAVIVLYVISEMLIRFRVEKLFKKIGENK